MASILRPIWGEISQANSTTGSDSEHCAWAGFVREDKHTFLPADQVIHDVNHRLSLLPEWKRHQFNERYLDADAEEIEKALTPRDLEGRRYLYLKSVYDDEREVERVVRDLQNRPDITFRSPVTLEHWKRFLRDEQSVLATKAIRDYSAAIDGQAQVCAKIFVRPVCVVSGEAGTGRFSTVSTTAWELLCGDAHLQTSSHGSAHREERSRRVVPFQRGVDVRRADRLQVRVAAVAGVRRVVGA